MLRPQAMPHAEGMSEPLPRSECGACPETPEYVAEQTTENENGAAGKMSPRSPVSDQCGIFGDDTELVPHVSGVTSALNLLGKVESWGIKSGTQVAGYGDAGLFLLDLCATQDQLLRAHIADGIAYELRLNKEEK